MSTQKNRKQSLESDLEEFLSSHLVERLSSGVGTGAVIELRLEKEIYQVARERKHCVLHKMSAGEQLFSPDLIFTTTKSTMRHLLDLTDQPGVGIPELGISVFEHIFSKDAEKKISVQLKVGLFTLFRKGYFSLLQAGGPDVAAYLAKYGFSSIAKIKEAIAKMRGSEV